MRQIVALMLLATAIASGTDAVADKQPSVAQQAFDKSVASNTGKAAKAYDQYIKELEAANQAILKDLERLKTDLNDPKRGSLSIQERAKAIEELDAKSADVRKGAIGDAIVARRSAAGDLLGDGKAIDIQLAEYGADGKYVNCTRFIREKTDNGRKEWMVDNQALDQAVSDPVPGRSKGVRVTCMLGGVKTVTIFANGTVVRFK